MNFRQIRQQPDQFRLSGAFARYVPDSEDDTMLAGIRNASPPKPFRAEANMAE